MVKRYKIDQAFIDNDENVKLHFKSAELSLRHFEYVNALCRSLSSQNIKINK